MLIKIDYWNPVFPAFCLACAMVAAYGGGWIPALYLVGLAWMRQFMVGEKRKALPRESYLVDPLPKIRLRDKS